MATMLSAGSPNNCAMKPYRDYACRIERGRSLVALYNNFIKAWERAFYCHWRANAV